MLRQCGIFCFSRFWNCSDSLVFFVFLDFGTVPTVVIFVFLDFGTVPTVVIFVFQSNGSPTLSAV